MLTFTINDGHVIEWHVNVGSDRKADNTFEEVWMPEKKPEIWQQKDPSGNAVPGTLTGKFRKVVAVYADGHELQYLLRIFVGLPQQSGQHPRFGRGCTWRGDLARFIYDNL